MRYTYIKAGKITIKHEISPNEDGNWYRVIENRSVKLSGQRPHREVETIGPDHWKTFSFESGEEVRYRTAD